MFSRAVVLRTAPTMSSVRPSTVRRVALLVALVAALPSGAWFVRLVSDVPPLIVGAAALPALAYAFALTRLDRREPEPRLALLAALLAGAVVAAHLSHGVNERLLAWAGTFARADEVRPLTGGFGAPLVEELAKAAVLIAIVWLGGRLLDGALDGIVYGGLVGIGFAFSENVVYLTFAMLQGGSAGLLQAIYVRALLGGFNHAAFTATTGAALGHAWVAASPRGRILLPAVGLAIAVVQHVAWNAVASHAINGVLCGPELGSAPCLPRPTDLSLFVLVPLLVTIFVGPGVLTLGAIAVLSNGREGRPATPRAPKRKGLDQNEFA
jgi:RsiW-degrading membrane proteinase PrsW (M82 family)